MYKQFSNEYGVSTEIADNIIRRSYGHPASFMILLRIFEDLQPTTIEEWRAVLQLHIEDYLNGTHVQIKYNLLNKAKMKKPHRWLGCRFDRPNPKGIAYIGIIAVSSDKKKLFLQVKLSCVSVSTLSGHNRQNIKTSGRQSSYVTYWRICGWVSEFHSTHQTPPTSVPPHQENRRDRGSELPDKGGRAAREIMAQCVAGPDHWQRAEVRRFWEGVAAHFKEHAPNGSSEDRPFRSIQQR
ncbi:hypothetical protein BC937DRAFT_92868 [Endogone sp. FLAS-F59071]|nr:hypothetical protein BC937DRAFT_92868 [Endogone sp. FLAS-F59071]|eukprot:RUS21379.1 hypothetical protein BC937DRAFT_92868 [Endogone sp. FLAS-F59071]